MQLIIQNIFVVVVLMIKERIELLSISSYVLYWSLSKAQVCSVVDQKPQSVT